MVEGSGGGRAFVGAGRHDHLPFYHLTKMRPTEIGWYWVWMHYRNTHTRELTKVDHPEVVMLVMGSRPRTRKQPPVLIMCSATMGGWQQPLDTTPIEWEWSDKLTPPRK